MRRRSIFTFALVRDFIGALVIKGVKKGVFLTTSHFTTAARAAVQGNKSDQKIVLIDGARLAALMIEHNLGVSIHQTFAVKRMDSDFFEINIKILKLIDNF